MLTRSQRRAISRDEARANPVPARPRTRGDRVNAPIAMPIRPPSSRSGQQRIDAKRNARAHFWRTIPIRISVQAMEATQGRPLHLFPTGTRIHGRKVMDRLGGFALDMHIPGMPSSAARGEAMFAPIHVPHSDRYLLRLDRVVYYDARNQIIDDAFLTL